MPEATPRRITFNLGTLASVVAIVLGGMAVYASCNADTKKSALDQLQDDTSYARATQAVAWINQNGWYVQRKVDSFTHRRR